MNLKPLLLSLLTACSLQSLKAQPMNNTIANLPIIPAERRYNGDWLITAPPQKAELFRARDKNEIVLDNGLIRRVFRVTPNAATVSLNNLVTGEEHIRAVKPESRVEIDGVKWDVGGLHGQPDLAFLRPDWTDKLTVAPNSFRCVGFDTGKTKERFPWKRARHSADLPWPPPGVSLTLHYKPPESALPGITVDVHYELYDGIPLFAKWLTVHNAGVKPIRLNRFTSEIIAFVEPESFVDKVTRWERPNFTVISDYTFGGMTSLNDAKTTFWETDPEYGTQVNYELKMPAVLESRPPLGPEVDIIPGGSLETFHTFELFHDSTDRERKGLATRRMYRTLAPWATENPLMMHLTSVDPKTARAAIDQCAEVGFEMVILSFGSGLNMEDASPQNIARFKELADYAHSKGIEIGGYSLLASRRIDDKNDVINPKTGKTGGAIFGDSPCLGSEWANRYFADVQKFISETGFNLLEHDGSYPGDVCASTMHPGHRGLEDSQWTQFQKIKEMYHTSRANGVFLNVPDWYILQGSNKTGMGYRETNWSLPRAQQHIHARQHIFDGTWEKAPTMGWMFVPLVQYQGGGEAATIEPLKDHLADYELHLANNLGAGVQACYRGPRLYDSEETKALVKKWVGFFKKHRAILESDILHLRRADSRDLDYMMHVNPTLKEKGLLMVFNPTNETRKTTLELPFYYTGLSTTARIREQDGKPTSFKLDRAYKVKLPVDVKPGGVTWFVIE